MKIDIDSQSLAAVRKTIESLGANIKRELNVAVNKTASQVKIKAARKLKSVIPVPVKVLKKAIAVSKKSDVANLTSEILMIEGYPIPLRYFGAKQTKKGVTHKRAGAEKSRGVLPHAFIVNRYRGNIYERSSKPRGPLTQQKGPAPSEYYQSAGVTDLALDTARDQLPKQINERIRFLTLKAKGQLKGKQK
jgi:hypothetical protein